MITPPQVLLRLMFSNDAKSVHFLKNIRSYNSMFYFISLGGKIVNILNTSRSLVFRLHGQNYHLIGSLLLQHGALPSFLYCIFMTRIMRSIIEWCV